MANQPINQYNHKQPFQNPRIPNDKVETRPENDGETGHVGHPADFADYDDEDDRPAVLEGFKDVAGCLQDYPEGGDDDGPEVDAGVAFEGDVDEEEEFDAHPVGDCADGGDEAECGWTVLVLVACEVLMVRRTYFHGSQPWRANVQSY